MAADLTCGQQKTVGADNNYEQGGIVGEMRRTVFTPHVAVNTGHPGGSAVNGRTIEMV